jgi:hypothetical protein
MPAVGFIAQHRLPYDDAAAAPTPHFINTQLSGVKCRLLLGALQMGTAIPLGQLRGFTRTQQCAALSHERRESAYFTALRRGDKTAAKTQCGH